MRPRYRDIFRPGLAAGAYLVEKPIAREFEGWGIDGIFHSKHCAYKWAVRVVTFIRSGELQIRTTSKIVSDYASA